MLYRILAFLIARVFWRRGGAQARHASELALLNTHADRLNEAAARALADQAYADR